MLKLLTLWLTLSVVIGGCSGNPPPGPPPTPVQNFGVTVRSVDGGIISPSAVIVADSGERIVGANLEIPNGRRIQFQTRATGGGWLTIQHEAYTTITVRVVLQDIDDVVMSRSIQPLKRLRADGRWPITDDGQPFVVRFVTGFRAVDYVADGNEAATIAFFDWARQTGFNGVRVLSSLCCWFDLTPEDGQRALPRTLELAQQRGLYLSVVGLAGTKPRGLDKAAMSAHIRGIGIICEQSPACAWVELANENAHPSQQSDLKNSDFLKTLRALISHVVLVAMGSNCCGESDEKVTYEGGNLTLIHRDRSRDTWNRVRHVREQEVVSANSKSFVVDDEAMGAGEVNENGRRSANPHEFFGSGVLSRIFSIGATFHCEDCLQALVPGPVQRDSAQSFVEGTRIVPDDVRLTFKNATWHDSPVHKFTFGEMGKPNAAIRAFSGLGSRSILVLVGVTGDPGVEWQAGWKPGFTLADRPGVRVLELVR